MHILIIPSWYPSPDNTVRGKFFREQALALKKSGHQVNVLAPHIRSVRKELLSVHKFSDLLLTIDFKNDEGMQTYRPIMWNWFPLAPLFMFQRRFFLFATMRAFDQYRHIHGLPDIIHAHSIIYGGYIAAHIKQKFSIPVVLTEHSSAFMRGLIKPQQLPIIRETLRIIDTPLAVSPVLARNLQQYTDRKIEVVGNIIDITHFTPDTTKKKDDVFVFSLVAFLNTNKGIDVLLEAFAQVFKGKQVKLCIGGDGDERINLEQLSQTLGIETQVVFLGELSQSQVRDLMQESDVIVSSSYVETFGVTLIEAMACGKPVIATRSGGPESFITEENGIIVPPGNVDEFAQAMLYMIENYDNYDAEKIREYCVSNFGEQAIVAKLEAIYNELVNRP